MTMHNRLRELRKAAGFRQADLAARVGMSQPTLSQIERGNLPLNVNWMRLFSAVLGCAPVDLLTVADNPDRLSEEERRFVVFLRTAGDAERALVARMLVPEGYPAITPITKALD